MVFSIFLLVLRYAFLLLLFLFIFRLVKWMVGDLKETLDPEQAPARPDRLPEKRELRDATGVRIMVLKSPLPELAPGESFPVGGELLIGRGGDNSIVVSDNFASTRHARVYLKDEQYWLEDLDSTNGTFLNGVQITQPTVLADEDRIRVGGVTFQFVRWGHEVGSSN